MFHFDDALEAGAAYALYRHGQDDQTAQLAAAFAASQTATTPPPLPPTDVRIRLDTDEDDRNAPIVNALDFTNLDLPETWDEYVGQESVKTDVQVAIAAAKKRGTRLPHMLFASGRPGIGKTTLARLVARLMNVSIIEIIPPFNMYTLVASAEQLLDGDILFIDEFHLLSLKRHGTSIMLKVLEDGVAFLPDGEVVELNDITVIAATTNADLVLEPVVDRFKVKPEFEPYTIPELTEIAVNFAYRHGAQDAVDVDLCVDIAYACRDTPRFAEELVMAAHDLYDAFGSRASTAQLLKHKRLEPDGMTLQHVRYLTALRLLCAREVGTGDDKHIEYAAGEQRLMTLLREGKQGLQRLERFMIERGFIDNSRLGRRLTARGRRRAEQFIREGKGYRDAA